MFKFYLVIVWLYIYNIVIASCQAAGRALDEVGG